MSFIDGWRHRVRVWLHAEAYDREIREEMQQHLALDAAGRAPAAGGTGDAHAARRRFGNPTYLAEERRRVAGLGVLDGAKLDARHLLRSLRNAPGFAAVTILTLALGIGVTTTVVSITDHVLYRSLPFRDPGRLMMMLERDDHGGFRAPSAPTALDWQRDPATAQAFEGLSFARGDGVSLRIGESRESIGAAYVDSQFFRVLGVRPLLGRLLLADDHRAGAPPATVMSFRLWKKFYAGDESIIGRTITVDSSPVTVIGVLQPGAVYPGFADLWSPISQYKRQDILQQRGLHADSRTIARLRPAVDSARAVALMRPVSMRLAEQYPEAQKTWAAAPFSVAGEIIGDVRPMLSTLSAAALAVLLLVCANVAGLLLARVTTRMRELALRTALGASRGRVVRQLLTESLILTLIGGMLGTAMASLLLRLSTKAIGARLPRMDELTMDVRGLLIAGAATLGTALLCGLWPAFRATRRDAGAGTVLRASALGSVGVRSESRLRRVLVTVQFALAVVLLIGAGLLLQSFRRAAAVDVGFNPTGVVSLRIQTPPSYASAEAAAALYTRLMDAARGVPGVVEAGFINHSPFSRAGIYTTLAIEGRSTLDSSNQVLYRTVSGTYLPVMRMSVAAGRWFDDTDIRSPGGSFVINETMARRYWAGANPVGQRIVLTRSSQARADFGKPLPGSVIGVVADVYQRRQDVPPEPEVYVPYTLETWPWGMLVVRARDGARVIRALARAVRSVDPRLVAEGAQGEKDFALMEQTVASTLQPRRVSTSVVAAFAAFALALACIGMYGVVAYGISQRTREIGVRKALGATDDAIAGLIMRESLTVIVLGVVIGCAGAFGGGRVIKGMLFNTEIADPWTYAATIVVLVVVAAVATYLPARRAMLLDPVIAMRGE